jgi:hypothetical protein
VYHREGALPGAGLLARLLAAADLRRFTHVQPDEAERRRLTDRAVKCGLLCPWTACLLVDERAEAERTDGQPALRVVPQMLASGWHGMGRVMACDCCATPRQSLRDTSPAFLRRCTIQLNSLDLAPPSSGLWDRLNPFSSGFNRVSTELLQLDSLARMGLSPEAIAELRARLDLDQDEGELCLLVWHGLLLAGAATDLPRTTQRAVRRAARELNPSPEAAALVAEIVACCLARV